MKKRLVYCLLAVILVFGLAVSANAATIASSAVITATADTATLKAGDEVTVTVSMSDAPEFSLVEMKLEYNPLLLEYKSYSILNSNFSVTGPGNAVIENTGWKCFSVGMELLSGTTDVNGDMFSVTFTVLNTTVSKNVDTVVDITYDVDSFLSDTNGDYTAASVNDANLTIEHTHSNAPEGDYQTYLDDTTSDAYSKWVLTTGNEPTCTAEGTEQYTCSYCNEAVTHPVDALGHDIAKTPTTEGKPATCTEAGTRDVYTCERCNDTFVLVDGVYETSVGNTAEPATGHLAENVTHYDAKASTKDTYGYYEYWYCSACGKYFKSNPTDLTTDPETYSVTYTTDSDGNSVVDVANSLDTEKDRTYLYLPLASYTLADVDGSGKVNSKDIQAIRRYIAGMEGYETFYDQNGDEISSEAADVDASGKINSKDIQAIRRYIAGMEGYEDIDEYYNKCKAELNAG